MQFKRLKEKPVIGIPLLIVIILIAAGSILRGLGMNYEEVLNSSSLDGLTDDQIEMTKTIAKFGTMFGGIFGALSLCLSFRSFTGCASKCQAA